MKVRARMLLLMGVVVMAGVTPAAKGQTTQENSLAVRAVWVEGSHVSGVYHAGEAGKLTVVIENVSGEKGELKGRIEFGMEEGSGFKAVSVTPVTPTQMGAGEKAKVVVAVTFGNAGRYGLRWVDGGGGGKGEVIGNPEGVGLECIFAPRAGGGAGEERWLGMLPPEAGRVAGLVTDVAAQTGVRKFLLDERFSFDEKTGVSLGVGASLGVSGEQVGRMLEEMKVGKLGIVLRVMVGMKGADAKRVEAFHAYVADAARRMGGALAGLVIVPEEEEGVSEAEFRAFYLAGYEAAKSVEKGVMMLGAGNAGETGKRIVAAGLGNYLDGIAVTDVSVQIGVAREESKLPLWVLPPVVGGGGEERWHGVSAAVGLAEGAAVVSVPPCGVDRGVVAHLLGGAAFYQKLHGEGEGGGLPYVASFQGDGFAVAVVAGLGAGTPLDGAYAGLAGTRTVVTPAVEDELPGYANLEVGDDGGAMRVVDGAGAAVDCRRWDTLYVPAEDKVVYLLEGGNAEDLMAGLRSAAEHRFPLVEVGVERGKGAREVTVRVRNISGEEVGGVVRMGVGSEGGKGAVVLGEKRLVPVSAGKVVEVPMELSGEVTAGEMVVVEVAADKVGRREGEVQRTAVRVGGGEGN